jgi:RNA-directed DNA polymerase
LRKTPISLQDLRRSLYVKAKAEPTWRFWGLYVHLCKRETLREAYQMAKKNDGAPGLDGLTFEDIEESGREEFLKQIQEELVQRTYRPMRVRRKEIPKDGNKVRVLSIPAIRDRVVQGAIKLILEPVFEADFQPGSYGCGAVTASLRWIPAQTDSASGGTPGGRSNRESKNARHRF